MADTGTNFQWESAFCRRASAERKISGAVQKKAAQCKYRAVVGASGLSLTEWHQGRGLYTNPRQPGRSIILPIYAILEQIVEKRMVMADRTLAEMTESELREIVKEALKQEKSPASRARIKVGGIVVEFEGTE